MYGGVQRAAELVEVLLRSRMPYLNTVRLDGNETEERLVGCMHIVCQVAHVCSEEDILKYGVEWIDM